MKLDAAAVNQTSSGMEVAVDTGAAGATRVALESTSEWRVDYIQYDGQERYIASDVKRRRLAAGCGARRSSRHQHDRTIGRRRAMACRRQSIAVWFWR
ncbi:unnamed protein product [Sphagnum balticum]